MNVSLYLKEHTVALKVPVGILKRNIGNQLWRRDKIDV
ncbi:Uncharacterised protein [Yersinia mollaretii]|nr:Uncharacterised protein [Yersinia mollaretii]